MASPSRWLKPGSFWKSTRGDTGKNSTPSLLLSTLRMAYVEQIEEIGRLRLCRFLVYV
jgi:hypothetical protein